MSWTFSDVGWLVATQWLQLSIVGVAIFYGLAESYREWQKRSPQVEMYGRKAIARHALPSFGKAA